jgi:hypothetical protein
MVVPKRTYGRSRLTDKLLLPGTPVAYIRGIAEETMLFLREFSTVEGRPVPAILLITYRNGPGELTVAKCTCSQRAPAVDDLDETATSGYRLKRRGVTRKTAINPSLSGK